MLNDFDMITHDFNQTIKVFPISDVHYGALEHCSKDWLEFCKKVEKSPDTYLILNGDLINNSVRSCKFANPFDELVRPREQKKKMVEFLEPIKDRILCATSGNHEGRSLKESDIDITYDIMAKLDIEDLYRPNACYMKVSLGHRKHDNTPIQSYTFCVTHGAGGGGSTGAVINKNEKFGNLHEGLDCLIVGHHHKGATTKPSKILIDRKNNKVTFPHYTMLSTVSWLNYGGYALRSMLQPSYVADPQQLTLHMSLHHKWIETRW